MIGLLRLAVVCALPAVLVACSAGGGDGPDGGTPSCASAELEPARSCANDQGAYREMFVEGDAKPMRAVAFEPLWSRDALCDGLDVFPPNTRDVAARPRDFAVGRFVVDGISRDVVLAILDHEWGSAALAVLDLASGVPLQCFYLSTAAEAGFIVRSAEQVDVFSTPADELLTPVSRGVLSVDRITLRDARVQRFSYYLGERSAARGVQVVPVGARGLAVGWEEAGVFGLDPDRADRAVWCAASHTFGARPTDMRWLVNRDGGTALVVQQIRERAAVVALDGCGVSAKTGLGIDGLVTLPPAFVAGQTTAALVNEGSVDGYGLQLTTPTLTRRELHCVDATQLSDNRWACVANADSGGAELRTFDTDGGHRHMTALPSTVGGERAGLKGGITAAAGGIVLAVSSVGSPPVFRLLAFADTEGVPLVGSAELPSIVQHYVDNEPPAVTAEGTVVVKVDGTLLAFRSNLAGLGPSAYPRGTAHGGNLNLGARVKVGP